MSLPPRGWEIPKELHPTEEGATVGPDYLTIGASGGPGLLDHCHLLRQSHSSPAVTCTHEGVPLPPPISTIRWRIGVTEALRCVVGKSSTMRCRSASTSIITLATVLVLSGPRRLIRMPSPETIWESNRHDNPERLSAQTPRKPSASHFRTEEPKRQVYTGSRIQPPTPLAHSAPPPLSIPSAMHFFSRGNLRRISFRTSLAHLGPGCPRCGPPPPRPSPACRTPGAACGHRPSCAGPCRAVGSQAGARRRRPQVTRPSRATPLTAWTSVAGSGTAAGDSSRMARNRGLDDSPEAKGLTVPSGVISSIVREFVNLATYSLPDASKARPRSAKGELPSPWPEAKMLLVSPGVVLVI